MRWSRDGARKLLAFTLVAATIGFIARTLWVNSRDLAEFDWTVSPVLLTSSVVAHVVVLAWGVFVWSRVLRHFGEADVRWVPLLRIWSLSNAARYVPGVVWQFLTAARLGTASGLPQIVTLSSMVVHVLVSLSSACMVAAFTLPLEALGLSSAASWALRVGAAAGAVASVHPSLIRFGLGLVPRALHRDVLSWSARWIDGLALLALAVFSWTIYGLAYFLFLNALAPVPIAAIPLAAGINALAFVAGYLAVPAPGGIGVRESAMTLLLTPLLPVGVAAVVAVAARVWSVIAEVGLVAVAFALNQLGPTRVRPPRRV